MPSDPDPRETVRFGISAPRNVRDKLDEYVRKRERQQEERLSRSEVAVDCLLVGLEANKILDDERAHRVPPTRERMGWIRQALYDFEADSRAESDILIDALAEAEDIDRDALEEAVLRLRLESDE